MGGSGIGERRNPNKNNQPKPPQYDYLFRCKGVPGSKVYNQDGVKLSAQEVQQVPSGDIADVDCHCTFNEDTRAYCASLEEESGGSVGRAMLSWVRPSIREGTIIFIR